MENVVPQKKRILVVGSINMDIVVQVEEQPKAGETLLGSDALNISGGKGANQAVGAARAIPLELKEQLSVVMLANVGTDGYGKTLKDNLQASGVNVDYVEAVDGSSGIALITVDQHGENMIVVSPSANGKLTPDRLKADMLDDVAMVVMQLEVPIETVEAVAKAAFERQIPVLLNPAPAQELSEELLSNLSILVVNESEAELLSQIKVEDKTSAMKAATVLRAKGVDTIIVTLGGDGVVWLDADNSGTLDAFDVDVVDTTAAGDTFCGALATQLSQGLGANSVALESALHFANAAAALAVTVQGAQPSIPRYDKIEAFLEQASS